MLPTEVVNPSMGPHPVPREWKHPHPGCGGAANGLETADADAKWKKSSYGALS